MRSSSRADGGGAFSTTGCPRSSPASRAAGRDCGRLPDRVAPQAWAAATPVLLLRVLLGLEPDREARALRVDVDELPPWPEGLCLEGVHAFGRCWRVRVAEGGALVEEMEAEPAFSQLG